MYSLKTLAGRLFQLVFGWYLFLAVLITGIQLGLEYASIRKTAGSDLVALGNSFAPSVSDALWTFDKSLLDSLSKGIMQTTIITGVKIVNGRNEIVVEEGHIPSFEYPSDTLLAPFQMHEVTLRSLSFAESHPNRLLGKMILYSNREVILERIKYSFTVILINSIVKTAGLWLIFYWAISWRLSRPLTELSNMVSNLDLKNDVDEPEPIKYPHRDEIGVLVSSLNDMRHRLSASHRELEQKVAERTLALNDLNHKLETLSFTDGLTNIANRRHFDEALENEWARALRVQQPLALLMIDVDLFKGYNDHYGHQAGDECLRHVAKTLEANSRRSSDLAARYGGEEFTLIAPHTDSKSALHLAAAIRTTIEALEIPHVSSPFSKVTVSIGVAVIIPEGLQQPKILIQLADKALYRAKGQGRNQVVLANNDFLQDDSNLGQHQ